MVLAFLNRPLWDAIFAATLGLWAAYALAGLALFSEALLHARPSGRPRLCVVTAALVPLIAALLWFVGPGVAAAGDHAQFSLRFARLRPEYERIAQALVAGDSARAGSVAYHAGIDYDIDPGPPLRVGFPQPGKSFFGDWDAIVYDPSGRVATTRGWLRGEPGRLTAAKDVVNIFNENLLECKRLGGAFFRCWFWFG
ncbi:MAG: hypothetical protein ABR499_10945 [Gemmatimonadaceae bacterium]